MRQQLDNKEHFRRGNAAAGDIVAGLDQISVAMGHAAVAATSIHNWLPKPELNIENFITA